MSRSALAEGCRFRRTGHGPEDGTYDFKLVRTGNRGADLFGLWILISHRTLRPMNVFREHFTRHPLAAIAPRGPIEPTKRPAGEPDRRKAVLKEVARLASKQGYAGDRDDGQRYAYVKLD